MKRFLACLLVLILLCGQTALAESPVQYTCGFAMDFEELVFIVNNERIDMPSAHYRLLTTDQFDQVQLSLSMERNGQELLALWAEELPDGNGSPRRGKGKPHDPGTAVGDGVFHAAGGTELIQNSKFKRMIRS